MRIIRRRLADPGHFGGRRNPVMPADTSATRVRLALSSGDPAKIAVAVAADPDIAERAAIREYDGGMNRRDAEIAALHDFLGDIEERQPYRLPAAGRQ